MNSIMLSMKVYLLRYTKNILETDREFSDGIDLDITDEGVLAVSGTDEYFELKY